MTANANVMGVEAFQIVPAIMPINLQTGANAGDWVSLKNFHRLTCLVLASAGSAANDLTLTIEQATSVSGAGNKALNFTRIDVKQGASLAAIGQFSTVTQAAANTYTEGTNGETQNLYAIDILPEDLDIDNGYDCVQLSIAQVGAAKIGCALYLLWPSRYGADPLPSAIGN
jgi:hypothetical protein